MITTTLERIRKHRPCEGWGALLEGLGKTKADDEPLPFARIVEINGLHFALWCCRAEPQYDHEWRLFAVWCARQVQHLMKDPRSIAALDVAERYAHGQATEEELAAAHAAQAAHRAPLAYALLFATTTTAEWYAATAAWHATAAEAAAETRPAAIVAEAATAVAAWYARTAQIKEFLRVVNETESRT